MEFTINHSSKLPLHFQVEELLRKLIEQPKYQKGEFLPPEVELAKKLGVSRNTIRQATNKLEYEGLIVRKKGYGTKVAENTLTTQLDSWHSFTQEMNEKGIAFTNYLVKAEFVEASDKITGFFNVAPNTKLLRVTRLRGDTGGPFVFFESYFHPKIGLSGNEDFTRPLYDILENDYNVSPAISFEKLKARLASVITSKRLGIKQGDPVLVRERFVSDPGNRPLEYNVGFYKADRFTYTINIKKQQ